MLFNNCIYHFLPDKIDMPKPDNRMSNKKIALIGFCGVMDSTIRVKNENDFKLYNLLFKENPELFNDAIYEKTVRNESEKRNGVHYYPSLSYFSICANDFKERLDFGKPLTQFKEKGIARDIPADKVKSFIVSYLEEVKLGGQKEVLDLVAINDKNINLKERDVDYYVIGIFKPVYRARRTFTLESTINYLLTVGSLMLVPWFGLEAAPSIFLVYDNKLNLVKKFEYQNKYTNAWSWWIIFLPSSESQPIPKYHHLLGSHGYYPQVYGENDIATFSKDFQEFMIQSKDKQ